MERDGGALRDGFFSVGLRIGHRSFEVVQLDSPRPTKSFLQCLHRVDRGRDLGANLSQAVICQMSGVTVGGNYGGRLINRYSLKRWTCGSYICRRSWSFCSAAISFFSVIPVSPNMFRKVVKLGDGRRSGANTGCRDLAKICAKSVTA